MEAVSISPVREYLLFRRSEISRDLAALEAELADISTVEKALNIAPRPSIRKGTVKHCVMLALRDCRNGMDTESLMAIVSSHGLSGKKNTVTPQLSRLKRDGFLTKRGRLWVLAAHKWLEE